MAIPAGNTGRRNAATLLRGVCSQFSDVHHEAFRQWAMLRHHEAGIAGDSGAEEELVTVAVLLTPRYDSARFWDTTVFAVQGDLEHSEKEIDAMRCLWKRQDQRTET